MKRYYTFTSYVLDRNSFRNEVNRAVEEAIESAVDNNDTNIQLNVPEELFETEVPTIIDLNEVVGYLPSYRGSFDTLGQYVEVVLRNGSDFFLKIDFDEFDRIIKEK